MATLPPFSPSPTPRPPSIPFPSNLPHAPSPLGFGFGFGLSAPSSPARTPSQAPTPSRVKQARKREEDEDMDQEDEAERERERSRVDERAIRGGKRVKTAVPSSAQAGHPHGGESEKKEEEGQDLGVLLASLPPASLLPLLTSLLTQRPDLKSTVFSLLPTPTLQTFLSALQTSTQQVLSCLPLSSRPSYILSRARLPLLEFAKIPSAYLPYFLNHPTSAFPALQASTSALLRLAAALPSSPEPPSLPVVWTRLVGDWRTWLESIDAEVNTCGGMYAGGVVEGWARGLDEMCESGAAREDGSWEAKVRAQVHELRHEWDKRVGWLIGRRPASHAPAPAPSPAPAPAPPTPTPSASVGWGASPTAWTPHHVAQTSPTAFPHSPVGSAGAGGFGHTPSPAISPFYHSFGSAAHRVQQQQKRAGGNDSEEEL